MIYNLYINYMSNIIHKNDNLSFQHYEYDNSSIFIVVIFIFINEFMKLIISIIIIIIKNQ